jgi:hypothetical protein
LTAALALIWAAFLMGRLGMALFLHRDWLNPVADGWLLLMLAVWSAVALGNAAGSHTPAGATGALVLVGACLGPILPTLVGIALKEAGPAAYGTAYGIVSAVGVTGGLALAPLFRGTAARGKALRGAPLIISGLLLAAACAALALVAER